MIIGTMRPEEARVFDGAAGYHSFHDEDGETFGSFEVFWHNGPDPIKNEDGYETVDGMTWTRFHDESGDVRPAGWYWQACYPGCLPDGDACGPFATSHQALYDADEWHPDNED